MHERPPPVLVAGPDEAAWTRLAPREGSPAGRALRALCRRAGAVIGRYGLIAAGDRILVGVSGGKDSLTLLEVLLRLRCRAPVQFDLAAVVVDAGFPGFDAARVATRCGERGVPTWVARADIWESIQALAGTGSTCARCARLRRAVLYRLAGELGYNVLALGHHADDAIETALLNMVYAGQLRALPPRLRPAEHDLTVIRPLITIFEAEIDAYRARRGFAVVDGACPLGEDTCRARIKSLVQALTRQAPRARSSLLAALGNVAPETLLDRRLGSDEPEATS